MNDEAPVLIEQQGPILRLSFNRPKALNALNAATLDAFTSALREVSSETRVIIVQGSGEKSFVAGADIAEMADLSPTEAAAFAAQGHEAANLIETLDAIVIAQVQGFALGGGCEMALACDMIIAGEKAKFGQPEVGLGVTPGFGGTTRLVRQVGLHRALQLLATGEIIKADQALAWGLVNEVVAQDELSNRVQAIAEMIAKNAPFAVAASKKSARAAAETDLRTANALEQQLFGLCFSTADQKEGMRAFIEKRKPAWSK
ncbi:MAG: enoyl-CoA hydratase-related protein [Myxococcota bacterium]|nr:enoyl-CoA hydratase-related protein [Myxococcota bacterium]